MRADFVVRCEWCGLGRRLLGYGLGLFGVWLLLLPLVLTRRLGLWRSS